MKLKRRKGHPPRKTSHHIKSNNTYQNQNRQKHQRKLQQHVIQHKTVHISQRENRQKEQLHGHTCDK